MKILAELKFAPKDAEIRLIVNDEDNRIHVECDLDEFTMEYWIIAETFENNAEGFVKAMRKMSAMIDSNCNEFYDELYDSL